MARAVRYGDALTVLMIDQDRFKRINDDHGHATGDDALCRVARTLRTGLRDGDVLARYAGDEFCVLLPNTDLDAALVVAERLRAAIEEMEMEALEDGALRISVGLATSNHAADATGKPERCDSQSRRQRSVRVQATRRQPRVGVEQGRRRPPCRLAPARRVAGRFVLSRRTSLARPSTGPWPCRGRHERASGSARARRPHA